MKIGVRNMCLFVQGINSKPKQLQLSTMLRNNVHVYIRVIYIYMFYIYIYVLYTYICVFACIHSFDIRPSGSVFRL